MYAHGTPTRHQVPGATPFRGGEGCWFDAGHVYVTTKGDNRVWDLTVGGDVDRIAVVYDGSGSLRGVDNVTVHPGTHHVFVAQDDAELDVEVLVRRGDAVTVAPVVRMVGPGHTRQPFGPVAPSQLESFERSEVTGVCFSPDGTRLYCSSQRYEGWGITYEIRGPWGDAAARAGRPQVP